MNKNDDNNFWSTKRGNAALKLGGWAVFVIILIVFFAFSENKPLDSNTQNDSKEKEQTETVKFETYDVMQANLKKLDFRYTYTITNNEV